MLRYLTIGAHSTNKHMSIGTKLFPVARHENLLTKLTIGRVVPRFYGGISLSRGNKILCDVRTKSKDFVQTRRVETKPYDMNTKVVKDVILYKYENPRFYKFLNIFALTQLFFWTYLSHFAFTTLKDAPIDRSNKELAWWRRINLGENKYRNTLTILSFLIGYGILVTAWLFTLKSVRYLVLRKGGEQLTIVTYAPFGRNRMTTVPLQKVSCTQSREAATSQLPIKVQNIYLHYILDMSGEFMNKQLFDYTAGLKRQI